MTSALIHCQRTLSGSESNLSFPACWVYLDLMHVQRGVWCFPACSETPSWGSSVTADRSLHAAVAVDVRDVHGERYSCRRAPLGTSNTRGDGLTQQIRGLEISQMIPTHISSLLAPRMWVQSGIMDILIVKSLWRKFSAFLFLCQDSQKCVENRRSVFVGGGVKV